MIKFEYRGGDNTRFVESSLKKLKKIYYKDKQLKSTLTPQFFTKPSKRRHDKIAKRIYIRKKFGDVSNLTNQDRGHEEQRRDS